MAHAQSDYYVPHDTHWWPFIISVGLFIKLAGFSAWLNGSDIGFTMMIIGAIIVLIVIFGWFGTVIKESEAGAYNEQVDHSFRWSMAWFIFSEVMFFAVFFGALFYARQLSMPWLSGEGIGMITNAILYPGYESLWPTDANGPGNVGGDYGIIGAWGIPALNTLILLSSGVTVTWAHWALKENNRFQLIVGLFATVALGIIFLYFQAFEYGHAFTDLNLTLGSGIYGATFFMLTGFHGLHVTLGTIMLIVILIRSMMGHFTPDRHFAFEGVAWYWHFVDVVWLGLFIFVYWI